MNFNLLQVITNTVLEETDTDTDDSDIFESSSEDISDDSLEPGEIEPGEVISPDLFEQPYGCKHYLRLCSLEAPCCQKVYSCRICHDEEWEADYKKCHQLKRQEVTHIICTICQHRQTVSNNCELCGIQFAIYYCEVCRLYDDIDKGQFHCNKCGMCRIGGVDNFEHCDDCNICMKKETFDDHKCSNMKEAVCPICFGNLGDSVTPVSFLKCGHSIHHNCMLQLLKTSFKCPMCSKAMTDLTAYNMMMDAEVVATQMPADYDDVNVDILCNECQAKSLVKFHIVGHKCPDCGTYNTKKI